MGLLKFVGRLFLIITNLVFFLLGLIFIILGFVLRFGKTLYEPYLDVGIAKLQAALADTNLANFDVSSINLGSVLVGMSVGLIVGGLVLAAIAMFGFCGACYKVKILLIAYAIAVAVFLLIEIITISVLYGKPDVVKNPVKSTMSDFKGLASSEVYSVGWNVIMIQFACCGVDSYADFSVSSDWQTPTGGVTLVTPIACCKTLPTGSTVGDYACATSFSESTNNGNNGCYETLWGKSFGNAAIFVPVLVGCGILQALFILFACLLAHKDKEKVAPA